MSSADPNSSKLADYSGATTRCVTVFGSSRTEPGTARWAQAETVGRLVAAAGLSLASGGYGGSMEAASKGAREWIDAHPPGEQGGEQTVHQQEVLGVVVSGIFPDRQTMGNAYLTRLVDTGSMLQRIETMTRASRYYVVLPGTMGTAQELMCIWMTAVLHPPSLPKPLIIALRDPWETYCRDTARTLAFPDGQVELIRFVDTAEEVGEIIRADDEKIQAAKNAK